MIKEIQGLRAIAILMVLFIHIEAIGLGELQQYFDETRKLFQTSTGVEIFFVLAGYFMMHSLSKFDSENKYNNILFFFVKKFKRLAPAMYFWMFVALLMSTFGRGELWLEPLLMVKKFFSTILFLRNFEEAINMSWFGLYWAISLEFQVFTIFSVIYFIFGRRNVIIISIIICIIMIFYRPGGNYTWLFRCDSILYGAILYEFVKKLDKNKFQKIMCCHWFWKMTISIVLFLILSSDLIIYGDYPNFKITISSITACVMVLLALSGNNYFYTDIKCLKSVIDWLASRSYSIFCCHISAYFLIREFLISSNMISQILCVLSMLFFSELTYRYIENLSEKNLSRR
jgi:acyltransferase 3